MNSSSDESSDDSMCLTPPDIQKEAQLINEQLLPLKSKERYNLAYEKFAQWKIDRKSKSLSENVFLAYFNELSKKMKPSSLWNIYSMLKCMVMMKHNLDLKDYHNLARMLKRQSDGYKCKKSKVLTAQNVEKFLNEAPDSEYLAVKVVLIFGIYGACRCIEITNITVNDIETHKNVMMITVRDSKTKLDRTFVLRDTPFAVVQKYQALRPVDAKTDRFFLNYRNCKCMKQVIGRHKISRMPNLIATYLNLPNPEEFTGHCFRRSSATLLADIGANLLTLKQHGGWKSDKMAESYLKDSVNKGQQQGKQQQQRLTNSRETCCKCFSSIPLSAPLVRCVQCAEGALFCARCLPNAHAHTTHALMQLPNTRVYRVLESVFNQLRLDVNELLSKNAGLLCEEIEDAGLLGEDAKDAELREEELLFDTGDEPLVEAPRSAAYPYLTQADMNITQDPSTTEQFDPLNTVIKQEDPLSDKEAFFVKEIKIEEVDIEIHELPVPNVSGQFLPENEPGVSTTARKRKANADRAGTSAQALKKPSVEGPESSTQALKRAALERPESSKQAQKRAAVERLESGKQALLRAALERPESSKQAQKRLESTWQAQKRAAVERIPAEAGIAIASPSIAIESSQGFEDIVIKLEPLPPEEEVYVKEEPGGA